MSVSDIHRFSDRTQFAQLTSPIDQTRRSNDHLIVKQLVIHHCKLQFPVISGSKLFGLAVLLVEGNIVWKLKSFRNVSLGEQIFNVEKTRTRFQTIMPLQCEMTVDQTP